MKWARIISLRDWSHGDTYEQHLARWAARLRPRVAAMKASDSGKDHYTPLSLGGAGGEEERGSA